MAVGVVVPEASGLGQSQGLRSCSFAIQALRICPLGSPWTRPFHILVKACGLSRS